MALTSIKGIFFEEMVGRGEVIFFPRKICVCRQESFFKEYNARRERGEAVGVQGFGAVKIFLIFLRWGIAYIKINCYICIRELNQKKTHYERFSVFYNYRSKLESQSC